MTIARRTALAAAAATLVVPTGLLRAAPAQRGEAVAWPTVPLLDGGSFGPEQAAGKAVVVVFWSTTCPFCRRHNPHVEKLRAQAAAAGLPLVVLGVARDRDADAVKRHARQHGYRFPITLASAPLAAALSTRNVIPLTVTVDRRGRLAEVIPGEMFEEDVLALAKLAQEESR